MLLVEIEQKSSLMKLKSNGSDFNMLMINSVDLAGQWVGPNCGARNLA